jgi:hypothetical protein
VTDFATLSNASMTVLPDTTMESDEWPSFNRAARARAVGA